MHDADAAMLDRLVEVGFDLRALEPLSPSDHERATRLLGHLELLDTYPVGDLDHAETLVNATLARVDRSLDEQAARMRLDPVRTIGGRRFRLGDFVAVASVALLAITVLVPIANWATGRSLELKCANNLRLVANGLESYTVDQSSLPMAASLLPASLVEWANYRNSDNLKQLASQRYCSDHSLTCPGDHHAEGCYAYQVPSASRNPRWNKGPRVVVVGDRNPLVDLRRHGRTIDSVLLNSDSHGGRGQNLLYTDGSVNFSSSPYVSDEASGHDDNIWLPFGDRPDSLLGQPKAEVDVFLLH